MTGRGGVAAVEVVPYALPFREPYVTARGTLTQRQMVLLRLRDANGVEGLGEAVPLSLRGGASVETVVRELEALAEVAALDPAGFAADARAAELSAPARCAVETALWDLEARTAESSYAPETDLKSTHLPDPATSGAVTCNATLISGEPAAVAADAERWAAAGFRTFKLKLGAGDDAGAVRAVRDALGPEARIRVDANAAWSVEQATETLRAIEPFEIELAEQPVETMDEAAMLAAQTSIPLAGDESIATVADAERAVERGAFALSGTKLSKVGGIEAGLAIARALPSYVASALDGPVGIAAGAVLARRVDALAAEAGRPLLAHGLATQRLFAATVSAAGPELDGDQLSIPPGPGLGVTIDEEALAAHRL